MKNSEFLSPAPANYAWPQCPEADQFIRGHLENFLASHNFAQRLAEQMKGETGTEFQAWVDHLILPKSKSIEESVNKIGFIKDKSASTPRGSSLYWHPFADLPRILITTEKISLSCAIAVEHIGEFLLAQKLSLAILGTPLSTYRESRIMDGPSLLKIIEHRGGRSLVPDRQERAAKYIESVEIWTHRPRKFLNLHDGMKHSLALAKIMVKNLGVDMAAWAFLEGERRYWQSRNHAAQIQKARQDRLGLGWANHDHHTFRSSRPAFPGLIQILQTFGFKKRERYYAGAEAGWGAQIMEQPNARLIIFADVDLKPDDASVDFTRVSLPELDKPNTVGLWCALHGESILDAGLHHLEAKFNFEGLRDQLKENGVNFMKPFSDFPHLRQAFSEGEWWPVSRERLDALRKLNQISKEAYEEIKKNGAVGSHMENLQRRDGFKGFNQHGVSHIISEVNPEKQALREPRITS